MQEETAKIMTTPYLNEDQSIPDIVGCGLAEALAKDFYKHAAPTRCPLALQRLHLWHSDSTNQTIGLREHVNSSEAPTMHVLCSVLGDANSTCGLSARPSMMVETICH
ncbi:hypothetical protein J1614_004321 [Plenodomus biglobosus]|nr:hypothetical protein J1614_004321 [Plenodomus biglobosus]